MKYNITQIYFILLIYFNNITIYILITLIYFNNITIYILIISQIINIEYNINIV